MTHIYIVRRHRLAPDHYQGAHRKVPAYSKEYEMLFATSDVKMANEKRTSLECASHMAHKVAKFKYSIQRVRITK